MTPTMMETLRAVEDVCRRRAASLARDAEYMAVDARTVRTTRVKSEYACEVQADAYRAHLEAREAYQVWSDIDALLRHERAARTPRPIVGRITIEEVVADYLGLGVDELPHVRIIADVHKVGGRWPWERDS